MRRTITILPALLAIFMISPLLAQENNGHGLDRCGTNKAEQAILDKHPELVEKIKKEKQALEAHAQQYLNNPSQRSGQVYTIPIVFHVIHDYGPENVSVAQIEDAVRILNRDMRKLNADTSDLNSPFDTSAADIRVEFKKAQLDPNGNCTNGITRTHSTRTYDGDGQMKNLIQWPQDQYLNVWVAASANGAAAYATKPFMAQWSPGDDGIVVQHTYLGSIGTGAPGRSRTLTHEVGHWINLDHTWGSSNSAGDANNCNTDDGIQDTPNTIGWTSCNPGASTCSSVDNVRNYMEYSYCSRMFTTGQKQKMRSALTSSTGGRNNLWTTSNLQATGTDGTNYLCASDFTSNQQVICEGSSVEFSDRSYNGVTSWDWTFNGAATTSSNDTNPTITYNNPGVYDVSLTAGDGSQTVATTRSDYITVFPNPGYPLFEDFENVSYIPNQDFAVWNPSGSIQWQITGSNGVNNSRGVYLDNYNNSSGEVDAMITHTVDVSSYDELGVSFDYAFAQQSTSNSDELVMYVSTDCGTTWSQRWSLSGSSLATTSSLPTSPWVPSDSNDWKRIYVEAPLVSSFIVPNLMVKFEMTSGGGNNVFLDNINAYDASPTSIEEKEGPKNRLNIYPNPVDQDALVSFDLAKQQKVDLRVYDLLGREAGTLLQKEMSAGSHKIQLKSKDFESGAYFIRLRLEDKTLTDRIFIE